MALDERYWRGVVSGENDALEGWVLRPVLRALSWPYAAVAGARRRMYERGWMRSWNAAAPVISVGNITTGGTGKTPLVAWVVRHLADRGRHPAILTRGYKAAAGISDEAALLEQLTGVPVVVDPDRVAGAGKAVAADADVLVMDDGFQHLRLRRDLDIVAIDATCRFGYGAVLPRGLLREPPGALAAADVVVITRCDQVESERLEAVEEHLSDLAPAATTVHSVMKPVALRGRDGRAEPAASLAGRKVWAFCGLGNPEAFYRTLADLSADVAGATTFNDHHAYSAGDLDRLDRLARKAEAEMLITTAKDAVKLKSQGGDVPIRRLEIDVDFPDGSAALAEAISRALTRGERSDERPDA